MAAHPELLLLDRYQYHHHGRFDLTVGQSMVSA
jgi:nuclear transcription factor Y, alpha